MHDEDVFSRYSFTISGLSFLTWGSFAWESLFFFIAVTSGIINIVVVCTALIVPTFGIKLEFEIHHFTNIE